MPHILDMIFNLLLNYLLLFSQQYAGLSTRNTTHASPKTVVPLAILPGPSVFTIQFTSMLIVLYFQAGPNGPECGT
jgi:uncharacterized membrane protein